MKVYKIEIMIIDHDELGANDVVTELECARFGNDCIAPKVVSIEERAVEWSDDHPLNNRARWLAAFKKLFGGT